ncbi:MAG: hypothetical protein KDB14_23525 [Planctomycetales bacterium]|nr:hypothetical protein [Planctomycetales bacterium]
MAEEPIRVWTDSTGEHRVEARLVKLDAQSVTLQRADNSIVVVPISKLSAADQALLKSRPPTNVALTLDPASKFLEFSKRVRTLYNGAAAEFGDQPMVFTGVVRKMSENLDSTETYMVVAPSRVLPPGMDEGTDSVHCRFDAKHPPWDVVLPGQVVQIRGQVAKKQLAYATLDNVEILAASGEPTEYSAAELASKLDDPAFAAELESLDGVGEFVLSGKVTSVQPHSLNPNIPVSLVVTAGGKTMNLILGFKHSNGKKRYTGPRAGKPFRILVHSGGMENNKLECVVIAILKAK